MEEVKKRGRGHGLGAPCTRRGSVRDHAIVRSVKVRTRPTARRPSNRGSYNEEDDKRCSIIPLHSPFRDGHRRSWPVTSRDTVSMDRMVDFRCWDPMCSDIPELRVKYLLCFAAVVSGWVPRQAACDCCQECSSGTARHPTMHRRGDHVLRSMCGVSQRLREADPWGGAVELASPS